MEDLASAVVDQLRIEDGSAKRWLLCHICQTRLGQHYYASIVPQTQNGTKRYAVELIEKDLRWYPYDPWSTHLFRTLEDATDFFCTHATGVLFMRDRQNGAVTPEDEHGNKRYTLGLGVVDPGEAAVLFEPINEDDPAQEIAMQTKRRMLDVLNKPTLIAVTSDPAHVAALVRAVEKQL